MKTFYLFLSCPKGLEYLLEAEAKELGLAISKVTPQGVYGEGTLAIAYQLCLWSRIANRVQIILFSGEAHNQQGIYHLCQQFPWQTIFSADKTFAIEFHGKSQDIRHTLYGAQVIKDAIVDQFKKIKGYRPQIEREHPNIKLHAYLKDDNLTLSLDLTGYSMHQRGYRKEAGLAPLKENLAAAILLRANWLTLAKQGYAFFDPFCGAGTLVIEAALIAANIAPGLLRTDQSLVHFAQHEPHLWENLRTKALASIKPTQLTILGADQNTTAIMAAQANAERAGVAKLVSFKKVLLEDIQESLAPKGLIATNPPYGERMGEVRELIPLYQQLGSTIHTYFQNWEAVILTAEVLLAKAIGLRAHKTYPLYNGPIKCSLYCFSLNETNRLKNIVEVKLSDHAQMFANRLSKNYKHLNKWAKNNNIECYRVYDADLPDYAFAIDLYQNYAVIQEYAAPKEIPEHQAQKRSLEVLQIVPQVFDIPPSQLAIKVRKPQKGKTQYQKLDQTHDTLIVNEGRVKLIVNLFDYLDTGLFLDHRLLRLKFAELPPRTRFLNLFCYTASASVHAALSGAITTNVDLSHTYLNWAQANFKQNNLDVERHKFIAADCLEWLKQKHDKFDVIFLDPPSFSNSKRMSTTLDIQRDHSTLINAAMKLLAPDGCLYFSTNAQRFKLSPTLSERFEVKDITAETIDVDFKRNVKVHSCFKITA